MLHDIIQLCPILCSLMDCRPPGFSVRENSQARILEWVSFSPLEYASNRGIELKSLAPPALAGKFFTTAPAGKSYAFK